MVSLFGLTALDQEVARDLRNYRNEAVVGRSFYVSLEVNTVIGKYFLNCMNKHSKIFLENIEPIYVEGFLTFEDVTEIDDYDFVIMIFFFPKKKKLVFSRVTNNKKLQKNKYCSRKVVISFPVRASLFLKSLC